MKTVLVPARHPAVSVAFLSALVHPQHAAAPASSPSCQPGNFTLTFTVRM